MMRFGPMVIGVNHSAILLTIGILAGILAGFLVIVIVYRLCYVCCVLHCCTEKRKFQETNRRSFLSIKFDILCVDNLKKNGILFQK